MQNDLHGYEIEDITPEESSPPSRKKFGRKHFIIFGSIFLAILVLIGGGYFAWNNYLSPSAQYARQAQANYQKYLDQQATYEAAMTADTYGGKTPQETLGLFVDALKNKDVDLAANYFLLDDDGTRNILIKTNIQKLFDNNGINTLLDVLSKLKPSAFEAATPDVKEFVVLNQQGYVEYSVTLKLNKYSNVWKIESI